jgi:hypothetical protein
MAGKRHSGARRVKRQQQSRRRQSRIAALLLVRPANDRAPIREFEASAVDFETEQLPANPRTK